MSFWLKPKCNDTRFYLQCILFLVPFDASQMLYLVKKQRFSIYPLHATLDFSISYPFPNCLITRFCHPKLFYFFLEGPLWGKVVLARLLCTFSLLLYPFSHALAIHNIHIDFAQWHSDIFLVKPPHLFSINFLIIHGISFHFLIIVQHWVDIFM